MTLTQSFSFFLVHNSVTRKIYRFSYLLSILVQLKRTKKALTPLLVECAIKTQINEFSIIKITINSILASRRFLTLYWGSYIAVNTLSRFFTYIIFFFLYVRFKYNILQILFGWIRKVLLCITIFMLFYRKCVRGSPTQYHYIN
jgi:hypothetical protein